MDQYRLPAEWEPQSGVQLTWPHEGTDWAPMLSEITETYREIAKEIVCREPLLIVVPDKGRHLTLSDTVKDNGHGGTTFDMVETKLPSNDTWARDHGFLSLISSSPALPLLLDFNFNGWGEKFPASLDNALNHKLYNEGVFNGKYVSHLNFVLEGGSIESDGQGTLFTTSSCLLAPHRNQPLTRMDIEKRLKEFLGVDRVLWIDYGHLEGDDTDGHIDTLVRICPNDTLLYIYCDDPQDIHYHDLQLMEEQLRTFRTKEGKPYRLSRLPLPHPIYDDDGERLPATYANFLVINGAVLCPTYSQPDLDADALAVIAQAFPGRDIVPIDCRSVIKQHGSLHCCTMQFPEGVLLNK